MESFEDEIYGRLGSVAAEVLAREYPIFVQMVTIKCKYIDIVGKYEELLEEYGLTSESVAQKVRYF